MANQPKGTDFAASERYSLGRLAGIALALGLIAAATAGCNSGTPSLERSTNEPIAVTRQAVVVNGGFEAAALTPWAVTVNSNPGIPTFPPTKVADLTLAVGGCGTGPQNQACTNRSNYVGSATAGFPIPAGLASADSLRFPFSGSYAAVVNSQGDNRNANTVSQTATMSAVDVDVTDGKIHLRFAAAPVLENPGHNNYEQPYFFLDITNLSTGAQLFSTFNFSNQPGVNWKPQSNDSGILYTDWQAFDIAPSGGALNIGDSVKITVIGAGCSRGGHWGEIYVDEFGTSFSRPNVNVTAPAYTQQNSDLTYTITAKNGGAAASTNTIVRLATPMLADSTSTGTPPAPTNTTFVSLSAAGATCTTPTVGQSGTVSCNVGTLAPGASYTFTVTVHVPNVPGAYTLPAWVNEGTYGIVSDQSPTSLTGNLVQTRVTTNTPVDLQATLTDGVASFTWGQANSYALVVKNNGPVQVTGATVVDTQPSAFTGTTWTCAATAGAACGSASGSGAINTTADLPVGGIVTYTVNTTITGSGPGKVVYSAVATPPAGYTQSVAFNNVATDVDNNDGSLFTLTSNKDPAGTGKGTVVIYPGGFTCGSACTSIAPSLSNNMSVAMTATPAPGSVFSGWSGGGGAGCTGTVNPCVTTITSNTTITSKFDQLQIVPTLLASSNGNSASVRPGDTADMRVTLNIPNGFSWPVTATNVLPAGLNFVSLSTPVATGTLSCSVGSCASPTVVSGATSTLNFGSVACTSVGGCTLSYAVRGQVASTATSGTQYVGQVSVTNIPAQNMPTLTVIEPALTIGRTASPTTGLLPSQVSTVTVTLANAGAATASVVGAVVSAPLPTGVVASNYQAGTCPTAAASFGALTSTFTFPNTSTTLPVGATCTFTYDLTLPANVAGNSSVSVPAATVTTQSISGAAPPAKAYTSSDSGLSLATAPYANGQPCTTGSNCVSNVCDTDKLCGYAEGDGPCSAVSGTVVCRSGTCSSLLVCGPAGGCLADADCSSTQFCNTQTKLCVPKLPNSTAVPTITGHTPPLTGTCNTAVGTAVCVSRVCDTADNQCGYADGDGSCTDGTAPVICRSGVCSKSGACGISGGCLVDPDCNSSEYCHTETRACVPKLPNGTLIPTVTGHDPTLAGVCNAPAASAVCVSAVCDTTDAKCGYADGNGSCSAATLAVCRSGQCAKSGVCGGCAVDSDCSATQYCNTPSHACVPKLPNGTAMPSVAGHDPTLAGLCTPAGATVACVSGVCDADNKCGYVDGSGSCTPATAAVCRSNTCSSSGVCGITNGCLVDGDCSSNQYCDTPSKACVAKLPNGTAVPTVAGHNPTLNGLCNAISAGVVCQSGVCDTSDNRCGYVDGSGTCTNANLLVCRSGLCSVSGVCGVTGGCIVDGDCSASQYCNTPTRACVPKLPNGTAIPTVTGHTPSVTGVCTATAAAVVCQSLVCDTADNRCGYADGDGSCTGANATVVCRSEVCSKSNVCGISGGCLVDADCFGNEYCNTEAHTCAPRIGNGGPIPTVTGHEPPLTGACTTPAAQSVCLSLVCDTVDDNCGLVNGSGPCTVDNGATICRSLVCDSKDNRCGYATGDGPCTASNASVVCRSKSCSAAGLCAPEGGCLVDADCTSDKFCDTEQRSCVPKVVNGGGIPTILLHDPGLTGTCTSAVGTAVCQSGVCDTDNKCGLTDGTGPCSSSNAASVCRTGTCNTNGLCGGSTGCTKDADCSATQFCDTKAHDCSPKVPNGTTIPTIGGHDPALTGTCTAAAAEAVCVSEVCDTADEKCGYKDGRGTCTSSNAKTVCRSGSCSSSGTCGKDTPSKDPVDNGTIEGGGIGCQVTRARGTSGAIGLMFALLAVRRRRHHRLASGAGAGADGAR